MLLLLLLLLWLLLFRPLVLPLLDSDSHFLCSCVGTDNNNILCGAYEPSNQPTIETGPLMGHAQAGRQEASPGCTLVAMAVRWHHKYN